MEHQQIQFSNEIGESIFLIKLDICINNIILNDQFEWDLNNLENSPEDFSRVLVADLVCCYL